MNNPKTRQQWIYEVLKKEPTISYTDCYAKYSPVFAKTRKTFDGDWNKANVRFVAYQKKANAAKEVASIEREKDAVKQGLKSKLERVMFLQNEVEVMEKQLRGELTYTWNNYGKIMNSHSGGKFVLPIQTQNELRKLIQSYNSEISKIEGDYAPSKVAQTDNKGNDIKRYDLSGVLTFEQIEDLEAQLSED